MAKTLEYYLELPYNIVIETWDDGEGPYYVARVVEIPHCFIHGDTPIEAVKELEIVKRDWIESNLRRGIKITEPKRRTYSGVYNIRISPSLHRALAHRAELERMSLNQFTSTILAGSIGYQLSDNKTVKETECSA